MKSRKKWQGVGDQTKVLLDSGLSWTKFDQTKSSLISVLFLPFAYWVKKITIKDKTDVKFIQEQNKNVT